MKFNTIIANPPYKGTLHVEFDNFVLKNCLNDGGYFVSISPVGQFTDCSFVERATKAVDREFIANEKYVRNIEIVETHEANKAFGICAESELGIKLFHKKPIYRGAWDRVLVETRGSILSVYEKIVKTFKAKGVPSLKSLYDNEAMKSRGIDPKTGLPSDKHADLDGKIYIKFTRAFGVDNRYDANGKEGYNWMNIISRDLVSTQNNVKPSNSNGGFVIFECERDRQKTLWRLLGKDCWLMRTCLKTVKRARDMRNDFVPFIDPKDERTDDEIAMEDYGMTPEEIQRVKDWVMPYISQHDYPRPD